MSKTLQMQSICITITPYMYIRDLNCVNSSEHRYVKYCSPVHL